MTDTEASVPAGQTGAPELDWSSAYALVGLEDPTATRDELEEAEAFAGADNSRVAVDPVDAAALTFVEVDITSLSDREREIYEAGFYAGYLSRQPEVDAAENAFKFASDDADRYYRAAFDHDYHDCSIHENRGKYKGAATRLLHWDVLGDGSDDAWGDDPDEVAP